MKLASALLIAVLLVLGGAACSSKSKDAGAKAAPEAEAAETAAAEVKPAAEAPAVEAASPAKPESAKAEEPPAAPAAAEPAEPPAVPPPPPPPPARPPALTDDVADLPPYPGAERTKREVETGTYEWSRTVEMEFVAKDTLEKVRAFYLRVIRENGWDVIGVREKDDEAGWKLAKGTSVAEVKLELEGRRRVVIKIERKDR